MDAIEIKRLAMMDAERFCLQFLGAGKRVGGLWRCGDAYGGRSEGPNGGSFVVQLEGERVGQCFENGGTGYPIPVRTVVDVWMVQKGCDFNGAIAGLREWLGVRDGWRRGQVASGAVLAAARPAAAEVRVDWVPVREGSVVWRYLVEERGIRPEVLRLYGVGECLKFFPQVGQKVEAVVFPCVDGEGGVLMVKYLGVERPDGDKLVMCNKGAVYHLFGMGAVVGMRGGLPAERRGVVVICEGEIDALTVACAGWPAVSVPFGAKRAREDGSANKGNAWVENDWEWLEGYERVYLAGDMDEEGRGAMEEWEARLGRERCWRVTWPEPYKDANAVWLAGEQYVGEALEGAAANDPASLKRPRVFTGEVWERFWPTDGEEPGLAMPFADKFPFRFRHGEATLWTGYSKHGKTICQTWLMVAFAARGERVCIASLEMRARVTLGNALRMAIGRSKPMTAQGQPDRELFERAMWWLDERFFVYDVVGQAKLEDMLMVFRYAARRHGVTQFVVDSLMKLDVHEEDTERQKQAMDMICAFAMEYGVHVHIVAHSRKAGEKRPEEKYPPRKHDVLGSVHLTNQPDNIVVVFRNKRKERELEEARMANKPAEEMDAIDRKPDALFIVEGQRHGSGQEPVRQLWFDAGGSWQYFGSHEDALKGARVYVS